MLSPCIYLPVCYSVVGGHPGTDTNVIPEQLLQTTYLLSANICASPPQFDGKYRTLAPFSAFSLILHSSLMFLFFSSQRPSVPDVFSNAKVGMVYRRGRPQTKKAFSGCAESLYLYHNILNLLFHANTSPMFHIWTFPPRFVSADVQVFTVTPVSRSSEEVAHYKQHLHSVKNIWNEKVSLYADDTGLSSRW